MTDQAAEIAKGLTKAQEDALLQRPVCGGRSGHGGRWTAISALIRKGLWIDGNIDIAGPTDLGRAVASIIGEKG